MSDIFEQVDDALRQDRMSTLWRRWGWMLVMGAVLIVGGTAAVVGWSAYETSLAEDQTQALSDALAAAAGEEPEQAIAVLRAYAEDADPNLAALARLRAAAHAVGADDPQTAIGLYDAVTADSDVDPVLRDLATVLSAALSVGGTDFESLRGRLAALEAANSPWRHMVNEVMAAAALEAGDLDAAEARLIAISDDTAAPSDVRRRAAELLAAIDARRVAADQAEAGPGEGAEDAAPQDEAATDGQPATDGESVTEEESVTDDQPASDDQPATDEEPVADEEPAADDQPATDSEPATDGAATSDDEAAGNDDAAAEGEAAGQADGAGEEGAGGETEILLETEGDPEAEGDEAAEAGQ